MRELGVHCHTAETCGFIVSDYLCGVRCARFSARSSMASR